MHVIVLASQKGGSSKTTVAAHLAVAAERAGAGPVAMIDADPQETLTNWWRQREADAPALAPVKLPELAGKLGAFVLFLALGFGMLGFVAKFVIQWALSK